MSSMELIPKISTRANETTAFTSLLVGVFLNSPMITSNHLRGLRSDDIFSYYGDRFRSSLRQYSNEDTLYQIRTMHQLQR